MISADPFILVGHWITTFDLTSDRNYLTNGGVFIG